MSKDVFMFKRKFFKFSIILLQFFSAKALADLPLSLEDLLTNKNEFRLSLNFGYANADRAKASALYDEIDTGNNGFVRLPVVVGERRTNSDIYTFTLGGSYGLNDKTEIYSRLTATANDTRLEGSNGFKSEQLSQLVFGVNHQFINDAESPAILGFAELTLAENTDVDNAEYVNFKTGQIGVTAYKSIDPVVLSITAGYRHNWPRLANDKNLDPSDLLFINPSISFAANHEVTLTGGVKYKFRSRDKIDNKWSEFRTTQTDFDVGVAYASSEKLTINLSIIMDVSGDSGTQTNIGWCYKFEN
jgi:hypothetical protein